MRAMILAAGLGTRLRPLTDKTPKALVPVGGRPMLEYTFDLFRKYGIREVVVNIHHHADQMRAFLAGAKARWAMDEVRVQDESMKLLGSGGGIAMARDWLYEKNSAALFWNPDGLIFPNLYDFEDAHEAGVKRGKLATLNLLSHPDVGTKFHPVYYKDGDIVGFGRNSTATAPGVQALHFAGAQILEKTAAELLPAPGTVSDLGKDLWFGLVERKRIGGFIYEGPYQDLGTPADVSEGNRRLAAGEFASFIG